MKSVQVLPPARTVSDQLADAQRSLTSLTVRDVHASEEALVVIGNLTDAHLLLLDMEKKRAEVDILDAKAEDARMHLRMLTLQQEEQELRNRELRQRLDREEQERKRQDHDTTRRERALQDKLDAEARAARADADAKELAVAVKRDIAVVQRVIEHEAATREAQRKVAKDTIDAPLRRRARMTVEDALLGFVRPTEENPFRAFAALLHHRLIDDNHPSPYEATIDALVERMRDAFTLEQGRMYASLLRTYEDDAVKKEQDAQLTAERAVDEARRQDAERLRNELTPRGQLNNDQR